MKLAQPRSQRDAARTTTPRTGRDSAYMGGSSDVSTSTSAGTGNAMSFGSAQSNVGPQQMSMLYQRMMGQSPMMGMGMGMGPPQMVPQKIAIQ